ncbi:two-component system response regulator RgaR [Clostridioides difficile]|nr:two-component system response regulator RgaR [Clostridioides difficile]
MFRVVICDDEKIQRSILKEFTEKLLSERCLNYQILEFSCGEDLISKYPEKIDIIFLDIQMKDINGIEVAKKIRKFDEKVEIIFTTAFSEYAPQGYEVRAYRYLVKPIEYSNFAMGVNLCIDNLQRKKERYIVLNSKKGFNRILIDSILYVETVKRDLVVHTIGRDYKANMSMKQAEKSLCENGFFRCHTSFIVNLRRIEDLRDNMITINEQFIPISKYRLKDLKVALTSLLCDIMY